MSLGKNHVVTTFFSFDPEVSLEDSYSLGHVVNNMSDVRWHHYHKLQVWELEVGRGGVRRTCMCQIISMGWGSRAAPPTQASKQARSICTSASLPGWLLLLMSQVKQYTRPKEPQQGGYRTSQQLDRQIDRQIDNQINRQIGRYIYVYDILYIYIYILQIDRQIDRQIGRQMDRQIGRQIDRQIDKQGRLIDSQIDRQVDNQLQRQTHIYLFFFPEVQFTLTTPPPPPPPRSSSYTTTTSTTIREGLYGV